MLILAVTAAIFTACASKGPKAPAEYAAAAAQLERFYNGGQYDSIFTVMFADTMQKALPPAETKALFTGLKNQTGAIKKMEFTELNFGVAHYKTEFEKGTMDVTISLDEEHKMNGLFFRP